jgi:anti-anti-sigma factor
VIDLRNLTFIASSCLQALMKGHERCVTHGHELRVAPGPTNVQRLFELTGIDQMLSFVDAADLDATAGSTSNGATPTTGA